MGKFFIFLLLTCLVVAAVTLFGVSNGLFQRPTFFLKTLVFLVFSTGVIYVYLFKANRPDFFLQLYLLTMTLKLLAYCAYNLVMILKDKDGAIGNVVFFMITYFIFTAVEIGFLYRKISAGNKP